jgi:hypothetical protein
MFKKFEKDTSISSISQVKNSVCRNIIAQIGESTVGYGRACDLFVLALLCEGAMRLAQVLKLCQSSGSEEGSDEGSNCCGAGADASAIAELQVLVLALQLAITSAGAGAKATASNRAQAGVGAER